MSTNVTLPSVPAIEAEALLRHLRMSPQKVRLVVDLIRGQRAQDAIQILRYTKKRAARDVEKVLHSAIANAERKAEDAGASLDVDELYVSRCFVNEGSRWKRLRPGPIVTRGARPTSLSRLPSIIAPRPSVPQPRKPPQPPKRACAAP